MHHGAQQVQASLLGTAHPRARSPAQSLLPKILPREQKEEENHTSPCFTAAAWLSVQRNPVRREFTALERTDADAGQRDTLETDALRKENAKLYPRLTL